MCFFYTKKHEGHEGLLRVKKHIRYNQIIDLLNLLAEPSPYLEIKHQKILILCSLRIAY